MGHHIPIRGEVDVATAPGLLRRLDAAIDSHPGEAVVVDLADVTFIDSTGLGVLAASGKRAVALGGSLGVVNARPAVQRVLHITGLDRVLPAPA